MTFDRRKSTTGVEPSSQNIGGVARSKASVKRQLGHLSLTAPTGNHVIESHSLCDCHFVDDRFPQNSHNTPFNMSLMATTVSLDRGIYNHPFLRKISWNLRSKSCIKFARAAGEKLSPSRYTQRIYIYIKHARSYKQLGCFPASAVHCATVLFAVCE